MKFDFCIGIPPYQEENGGAGASASPVYNKFIEAAKTLNPEIISMIIPAKWYSGGKGLDNFRREMLNDERIARLVDYTNSSDCFPGVDVAGGICYFLWDKDHKGECKYTNYHNGKESQSLRRLSEYETFIRYPIAAGIIRKVMKNNEKTLSSMVSSRKPFGLSTSVKPIAKGKADIKLRYNKGLGPFNRELVETGTEMIDQWKIIISYLTAEHAGQPDKKGQFRVLSTMEKLPPGTVCSETYLVAGSFDNEKEADNFMGYLKTRFARFLIGQIAVTQHITKSTFNFVPKQDFKNEVTEQFLYKKYNLTHEEIAFIETLIKPL